jgi:hypothetical protein
MVTVYREENSMKKWILSYSDLMYLILALKSYDEKIRANENNLTSAGTLGADVEEYLAEGDALQKRLYEIQQTLRKEREDEDDYTSPWLERDQAIVTVVPKPGDETYAVMPWDNQWAVVEKANPVRPVGEHLYTKATHAHRKKRELNRAARMAQWPK